MPSVLECGYTVVEAFLEDAIFTSTLNTEPRDCFPRVFNSPGEPDISG